VIEPDPSMFGRIEAGQCLAGEPEFHSITLGRFLNPVMNQRQLDWGSWLSGAVNPQLAEFPTLPVTASSDLEREVKAEAIGTMNVSCVAQVEHQPPLKREMQRGIGQSSAKLLRRPLDLGDKT
jgi:hypothetical protein